MARGDEHAGSDVDFLVRFGPGRSLFDQAGLVHDLEQLLGVTVDVVSEGGLRDADGRGSNRKAPEHNSQVSARASALVGAYVHVITDDVPGAADAGEL